ncbi:igE-binding protein-like [Gordionus sp. m RMFG-2023]|uniref:igE-binding protein-like n=1 Tax=Gordionus sp. m RMFG-2023 TaxID=3053472 RepID=UPI0031FD577E
MGIVIKHLKKLWSRFGILKWVISDGGPRFVSEMFGSFCLKNNVQHMLAPPYHPSFNGQAERLVAVVKSWLKKAKEGKEEVWIAHLYNNNGVGRDGKSPSEKMLGRKTNTF